MFTMFNTRHKIVINKVVNVIKNLKGVIDLDILSEEDKNKLLELESSRGFDLIPVVNEGAKACLTAEYCISLLKNKEFRPPPKPTILLVTDKGRVLGQELVSPDDIIKFKNKKDVFFISDDFVVFLNNLPDHSSHVNKRIKEKEMFLLPPVPFPELEEIDEIYNIVSGSPSALGDMYIRKKYGYPDDPKLATILVGFAIKK